MPAATGQAAAGRYRQDSRNRARRLPHPGARQERTVRLMSRNGHDRASRLPQIAEAMVSSSPLLSAARASGTKAKQRQLSRGQEIFGGTDARRKTTKFQNTRPKRSCCGFGGRRRVVAEWRMQRICLDQCSGKYAEQPSATCRGGSFGHQPVDLLCLRQRKCLPPRRAACCRPRMRRRRPWVRRAWMWTWLWRRRM